jgi:hypothetical protein
VNVLQAPPTSTDGSVCANCGAPLAADQRYCLSCGQAASPVRLAFLDVLQSESPSEHVAFASPAGYLPSVGQDGVPGWLRRNSGLLSLLTLLLMSILVGLLVGHWLTQRSAPSHQVVTIQGLSAPAASTAATGGGGGSSPTGVSAQGAKESASAASGSKAGAKASAVTKESKSTAASEAAEVKEVEEAETKSLQKPVKASAGTLKALQKKTGKSYSQEINKLANGTQPIEG